jgi:hypothetical protein
MFCDKCGTPHHSGQRFCSRCGKEFAGMLIASAPTRSRVAEHIRLVGILWLAWGAFEIMSSVVVYILSNTLFSRSAGGVDGVPLWMHPFMSGVAVLVFMNAIAGLGAGWGLLQREPWARLVSLVLAFVSLFYPPFGTALGVYTLWVLLPTKSEEQYQAQIRDPAAA